MAGYRYWRSAAETLDEVNRGARVRVSGGGEDAKQRERILSGGPVRQQL